MSTSLRSECDTKGLCVASRTFGGMAHCLAKGVELELRQLPGNNVCCDCDAKGPQWASVSFGVFMCLECSGRHRALGVHISFVRSVTMDSWSEKQIQMMRLGGNDSFNRFLSDYDVPRTLPISQKYHTSAAEHYRERLSAKVNGTALPTSLPSKFAGSSGRQSAADTHGSDPLPGESESDYIARQRRLQEEARQRMREKFGASSGLSSSGRMQGIGSDPNYNPNESSAPALDFDHIADVSQRAFSFFQTSFASFGEQVSKSTQQLMEDRRQQESAGAKTSAAVSSQGEMWDSLTTNAFSLWKSATDATSDFVTQLTNNEEDDFRFPRPEGYQTSTLTGPQPPRVPEPVPFTSSRSSSTSELSAISPKPEQRPNVNSSTSQSSSSFNASAVTSTSTKLKVAPTGDDFFANFGV